MWASILKILEPLLIVTLDVTSVVFPVLDTGIQVWNGITINKTSFVKNMEWGEVTPAYESVSDTKSGKFTKRDVVCLRTNCSATSKEENSYDSLNGDFTKARNKLLELEWLNLEVTYETVISIAIIQFPAVCLALFGVYKAVISHGVSCQAVKDSLHA